MFTSSVLNLLDSKLLSAKEESTYQNFCFARFVGANVNYHDFDFVSNQPLSCNLRW